MATIGTLLIELSANVARLENDLGKAASHVRNTERMIQQSVTRMNGFFGLLGVAAPVAVMVGFVKSGIDAQDMLATLSEKTGTSVRDLAGLKYAAEQNSASLESVANAGKKLATSMADKPALFRSMGITAKTSTDAMIQMADIFANMPDGVEKTALAVKLMGKNGEEMIPFLNQGSDSLRKLIDAGKAMSPVTAENAARAKEFNDQLNTLSTQSSNLGIQLANRVLHQLTQISIAMGDTARESGLLKAALVGIGGIFTGIFTDDLLDREHRVVKYLDDLRERMASVQKWGTLGGMIGMGDQTKAEMNAINAEMIKYQKELEQIQKTRADQVKNKEEEHKKELERQAKLREEARKKADEEDKKKNATDGIQVLRALELDYQNVLARRAEAMNAPLLSTSQRALAEDLRAVHDSAAKSRVELEKLKVAGSLSPSDYEARKKGIKDYEDAQVASITRMRTAQDELNRSWQFGAKSALRTYLDEVNNVAKQSEALFGRAFKGMEDALVQFVQTGKMDFASLRDSIIADLVRIQIQQTVTGPLMGMIGGMLGMGYGDTAGVAAGVPRYEGGGFTGSGSRSGGVDGRGGFPAILHPNETVVDHTVGRFSASSGSGSSPSSGGSSSPSPGGGKSVSITYAPIIQIDSRTDQAEVHRLVSNAVKQGNAELVDKLQRQGAI